MNIFAVDPNPILAARMLPDKHIVKMPLETAQMLSIVCSDWYRGWGSLPKKDGSVYATERGAFRNHPCTVWAAENDSHLLWLILHGHALCEEYTYRFKKIHSCAAAIRKAGEYLGRSSLSYLSWNPRPDHFARAMPDDLRNDTSISDVEAYRRYLNTKKWVAGNYRRVPERRPDWIVTD